MDAFAHTLFDLSPAGIILFRPLYDAAQQLTDFAYEQLNPAAQHLLRLPPQPADTFLHLYPHARETGIFAFYRDTFCLVKAAYYGVDYQHDGLDAYYQLAAGRVGELLVVTFTDTADRQQGRLAAAAQRSYQAEQVALAQVQALELFDQVFAQAPAGIWVTQGPDYVLEFVNPLMAQLMGRARQQLLGQPYLEVLPELRHQGVPELLAQAWTQGEPIYLEELPVRLAYHTPQETGYFTFVFQPLRNAQGLVARLVCVALDVTAQVLARQQVDSLNQALEAANEELTVTNEELTVTNEELHTSNRQLTRTNVDLDTFVYTASHDLKAPITNIEGLLGALDEALPDAVRQQQKTSQLLRLLGQTTERFRVTIDQLTDVSRWQHAQNQPPERVLLAPVVEAVHLDVQPLLRAVDARLAVHVGPDVTVQIAPQNLRSIVYNLLSNAIKYRHSARRPLVSLRAICTSGLVLLQVQDNGLGLSEQQQQQGRLFGLFQRLHTHVEGTGVGLYMVKRMVENAGGTIAVQSREGEGRTFTVTLRC